LTSPLTSSDAKLETSRFVVDTNASDLGGDSRPTPASEPPTLIISKSSACSE
jgi:hypothetical protein